MGEKRGDPAPQVFMGKCDCAFAETKVADMRIVSSIRILLICQIKVLIPWLFPVMMLSEINNPGVFFRINRHIGYSDLIVGNLFYQSAEIL